jgi:hypothetical protein
LPDACVIRVQAHPTYVYRSVVMFL